MQEGLFVLLGAVIAGAVALVGGQKSFDGEWWESNLDRLQINSNYGKKNRQEKWAEIFSEYYTGNRSAMQREAVDFIEDLMAGFKEAGL